MTSSKDCKKMFIPAVVAVVVLTAMEFILHAKILVGVYQKPHYAGLWNPHPVMASRKWAMFLAYFIFGFLFTKIYTHGYEPSKPVLSQGIRYGLLVGIMVTTFCSLIEYMIYPISLKLAGAWIAGGVIECVILGAIVASIYRPGSQTH